MDGFIRNGNANSSIGDLAPLYPDAGGAITLVNTSDSLRIDFANCFFQRNAATLIGVGLIYNISTAKHTDFRFNNCAFSGNEGGYHPSVGGED